MLFISINWKSRTFQSVASSDRKRLLFLFIGASCTAVDVIESVNSPLRQDIPPVVVQAEKIDFCCFV